MLAKRLHDEFHRIKREPNVAYDEKTIYNLEEIWKLNTDECNFNIVLEKQHENDYKLFVQFSKSPLSEYRKMNYCPSQCFSKELEHVEFFRKNSIRELPREVNDMIFSFLLPVKVAFQFSLKNDKDYPFIPSSWIVERYIYWNSNHTSPQNSGNYETYHKHLVKENELIIKENWSPVMTIDKQILSFISNLNFPRITCP
jgi:hypothetical protein